MPINSDTSNRIEMYYTYAYLREDGTPFYIGKGKDGRINKQGNRKFKLPPTDRRIFLKQNLTEEEALRHEAYIIHVIGKENLINQTTGGQGTSGRVLSQGEREHLREVNTGKVMSPETKEKISISRKGKSQVGGVKKHSPETREKMRLAHLGRKHTKETKEKMSKLAKDNNNILNILNNV